MPVDNFNTIRKLLTFESTDEFYFLQILLRKKDKGNRKVNGTNNNSRLIKAYYVHSLEYFDFIQKEVIQLCEVFGARAMINLNKRSYKKMALSNLKKVTDQLINEEYDKAYKSYHTVCGKYSHDKNKTWVLDVDEVGRDTNSMILTAERDCRPEGKKFVAVIPSKNGYHIIMKPFDKLEFLKRYPDIEIHVNNPTNLYIP